MTLVEHVNFEYCPLHHHVLGEDPKNPGYTLLCVLGCGPYQITLPGPPKGAVL